MIKQLTIVFLLSGTYVVNAQAETDFTFIAGYRAGGSFEEATTGNELKLEEGESYAFTMDVKSTPTTWVQILYSHQESRLKSDAASPLALMELDVDYLHAGGVYEWPGNVVQPYLVGTLGVTYFHPDAGIGDDVFRFSIGFGAGARIKLTNSIGLKLEARGYTTFLDSDGAMFCGDSGCRVIAASSTLWQSELRAGLSFRF